MGSFAKGNVGNMSNLSRRAGLYTEAKQSSQSSNEAVKTYIETYLARNNASSSLVEKALQELGKAEPVEANTEMRPYVPLGINGNHTAWCGYFMGYITRSTHNEYGAARSWKTEQLPGFELNSIRDYREGKKGWKEVPFGSIIVFEHHVAFAVGRTGDGGLVLLGGNQNDAVQFKVYYNLDEVIGVRAPTGQSPVVLPIIGNQLRRDMPIKASAPVGLSDR